MNFWGNIEFKLGKHGKYKKKLAQDVGINESDFTKLLLPAPFLPYIAAKRRSDLPALEKRCSAFFVACPDSMEKTVRLLNERKFATLKLTSIKCHLAIFLRRNALLGYKFRLNGLGIFRYAFSGTGKRTSEEVVHTDIKNGRIHYTPDMKLKSKMSSPEYARV